MRASLEEHLVELREAPVDEDPVALWSSEWRDRTELEVRVGARQLLLGREADLLGAAQPLASLPDVEERAARLRVLADEG